MLVSSLIKKTWLASALVALGLGAASCDQAPREAAAPPAYPLTVCVVSDEELGSMGEPHVIQYEGREVRLCCSHCEEGFAKDPRKHLKKLDEAAKNPTTRPAAAKHDDKGGHDHQH